ncbi:MAG: MlaD family protein [Proteobacteria bacterium]|nr:MlaD family protein [Pseudomonadota bacterium]
MKSSKVNYVLVGSFVLAVIAGIIGAMALLTGRTGATDAYHIVYKNVSAVEFGTRVVFEGFPIGQVEEITPINDNGKIQFRVDVSVQKGWRIPSDTVAKIAASGLLSAVTISLAGGQASEALKPGAQIIGGESADVMAAVSDLARDISALTETDIKPLLANMSRTVGGIGKLIDEQGDSLVKDLKNITSDISQRIPVIADSIDVFTRRINESAVNLGRVLNNENINRFNGVLVALEDSALNFVQLTKDFEATRRGVDQLVNNLNTVVSDNKLDVDRSIVDLRHSMETVSRHIDAINQNLEGASRNMLEFSRQIRANPGLLLSGQPAPDNSSR